MFSPFENFEKKKFVIAADCYVDEGNAAFYSLQLS